MNYKDKLKKANEIKKNKSFKVSDIDFMLDLLQNHASFTKDTPMNQLTNNKEGINLWELTGEPCNLELPNWFNKNINSDSKEFYEQQIKLWKEISGRNRGYDPELDEMEEKLPDDLDVVREPGIFSRKGAASIENVAHHKIASGRIMLFSNLEPGDNAIEYGAGFGYTAVDLARMGVNVDTVDISKYYCDAVEKQADFYKINLKPYHQKFGYFPSNKKKYKLIWFYESFHHCLNFIDVVKTFKKNLTKDGIVLMAAEPIISNGFTPQMPLDWGLRLDKLAVCATRWRGWFELGFNEGYIIKLFINNGFQAVRHDCDDTHFGITYVFKHRSNNIDLASSWLPYDEEVTWNQAEPSNGGRWSKDHSKISLDTSSTFNFIEIDCVNFEDKRKKIGFRYGKKNIVKTFKPGESIKIRIKANPKADLLEIVNYKLFLKLGSRIQDFFWSNALPSKVIRRLYKIIFKKNDLRVLGIFVRKINYL